MTDTKIETPAEEVRAAAEALRRIGVPNDFNTALADLFQHIGDDMSDDHAEERDYPNHLPQFRRQVCDTFGTVRDDWTAALAAARLVLGSSQ